MESTERLWKVFFTRATLEVNAILMRTEPVYPGIIRKLDY